ncbi:hypothetical protein NP233_g1332 [Leucocoprinus birnbaumii]|uniref:Xylanolytic transcriptional activator regulatory domain-containing protein n=1 Tax=Leucocoprinus birnbaumii TaxID=56174 RepID=A0AAD5YY26_9AGAR|nr:hypothetical protein NP233_g1332 [Leucocoprinus birnbaumii]
MGWYLCWSSSSPPNRGPFSTLHCPYTHGALLCTPGFHPPIAIPVPIVIPSAPILPEHRLVFGNKVDIAGDGDALDEPPSKKRKKDRACDYCRRRKIKCDGPWRQGQVAQSFMQYTLADLTRSESSKPRGPPKAYVTSLEDRIERLEDVLKQLCPNTDFSEDLGPPIPRGSWKNVKEELGRPLLTSVPRALGSNNSSTSSALSALTRPKAPATLHRDYDFPMSQVHRTTHLIFQPPRDPAPRPTSKNESAEETVETGKGGRHQYGLNAIEDDDDLATNSRIRFHGRSSTAGLVEATRKFKHMSMQERSIQEGDKDPSERSGILKHKVTAKKPDNAELSVFRRPEFWVTAQWETAWTGYNIHSEKLINELMRYFPPEPVASELLDIYFRQMNTYLPLLHRPTFERYRRGGLHKRNVWWHESGSEELHRWVQGGGDQWKAVGWKWFFVALDVHCSRRSLSCPATLLEIQTLVVMVLFLRGTTGVAVAWLFVSIGMRKAQDRGAHRRTVYRDHPNADDELWKRAFWILLVFDHILGASLGRGIATGQEDYDLDIPLEVDDEYWETGNPKTDFKQPKDLPSQISAFNHYLKLTEIIGFTAKTLYPVDKRKVFFGFIKGDWTAEVVRQLKMALEEWEQTVPEHLRWDPEDSNLIFSRQAASIYSLYYCVTMTIWRPFCPYNPSANPRSDRTEKEERHSIAMRQCAKSIKACAGILEVELRRGLSNHPNLINVALVCAGTLAIILYVLQRQMVASGRGKTLIRDYEIESTGIYIADLFDAVDVCMKVIKLSQSSWEYAEFVMEQLKAALPSDRDQSFESMDIPMPAIQGISDVMRVPGHLGSSPPGFGIPSDATFSFTDHNIYQGDISMTLPNQHNMPFDTPAIPLQPHNHPPAPSSVHSRYHNTATSYTQNPLASFSNSSRADYAIPSTPEHAIAHGHDQYSRYSSKVTPYPTSKPLLSKPRERHPSTPDAQFIPKPRPIVSNKTSTTVPRLRVPDAEHSDNRINNLFFEPTVDDHGPQAEDRSLPRTRTTSLINEPPVAMRRDFTNVGSSLRRTSFPSLQAMKNGHHARQLGFLSNKSLPNVAAAELYDEPVESFAEFPNARRLPPLTPTAGQLPSVPSTFDLLSRPRTRSIDRIDHRYSNQVITEEYARRRDPSTHLKTWDQHPPPPVQSNQRYTHHSFVPQSLSDR